MNVLFMDDDEGQRESVKLRLRSSCSIVAPEFYSADEGYIALLEEIEKTKFDAIILDLNWDTAYGKSGVDAAQTIRAMYAAIDETPPVLLLYSANTASLSDQELTLFDRILRDKGKPTAIAEMKTALSEITKDCARPGAPVTSKIVTPTVG